MTLRSRIQAVTLFASGLFATFLAVPTVTYADLGKDIHIQEAGEVRIDVDREAFKVYSHLFRLGYPPATVMMHAVTTGMSLNDILYIAITSNVERAQEYYDTAKSLTSVLPGWVCQEKSNAARYIKAASKSTLGSNPTIHEAANLFFDKDLRLVPFPDWEDGRVHMDASVSELSGLIGDNKWYVAGKDNGTPLSAPNRPVFVSLYKSNKEIVVGSGGRERIRRAQEQGTKLLPVVLVYNNVKQRPISSFSSNVTLADLAQDFYTNGVELTAVPEWEVGDYHKMATPDEIRAVVKIPDRKDISQADWDAAVQEFENNNMTLSRPLLLTLVRSGRGHAWINDPAAVAVASNLGVKQLPIVLFYHSINRTPCGEPSNCQDMLCRAATAAGAPEKVCESSSKQPQNTAAGAPSKAGGTSSNGSLGMGIDPHLYNGLRYTQSQCTS
ncbi:MAG: hypothetical protein WB783_10675 [Arenicellales bacterium]